MLTINKLDGVKFSRMIISGANNLYNNKKTVDDLNVFPVPDGDTGTNMSLTAAAMVEELKKTDTKSVGRAADRMAFSTLRGARGNSGVILSQLFRGMARYLKDKDECNASELAGALEEGANAAYKAVMKPTEGTILTVARAAAKGAADAAKSTDDITEVIAGAIADGKAALEKTTEMLPALKSAGVVDAGGQGWMFLLEGVHAYLESGKTIRSNARKKPAVSDSAKAQNMPQSTNIRFKYCTEFIIEKKKRAANIEKFRETIKPKGNCMLVIDDDDVVKVHIHTNHPGAVIEEAIKLGEIINLKVDNMKRQHNSIVAGRSDPAPAVVATKSAKSDTAVKTKTEKRAAKAEAKADFKDFGFVAVCAGRGMADILTNLGIDRVVEGGQSMNPSTHDIVKAITKVKAKTVFVFPNNKNIIMAANQSVELIGNKKVVVIPTVNIPQSIKAMLEFNPAKTAEENESRMTMALDGVKAGQITYAVRDTEIDGEKIGKGNILGVVDSDIKYVSVDLDDVLVEMIADFIDEDTEYVTVYYGKDIKKQKAQQLEAMLAEKYAEDEIEVSFKRGGQPLYYYIVSAE